MGRLSGTAPPTVVPVRSARVPAAPRGWHAPGNGRWGEQLNGAA